MLRHGSLRILFALTTCVTVTTTSARADDTTVAGATVLFDEGVKLMDAGRHAEACPKLARSQALAPSGGTLLALGDCYEKIGRTASAWVAFRDLAARAATAGKRDAEASALGRAKKLEPNLPHLTIAVPAASRTPGLEVRRDGELVKEAELGLTVPVDPGSHEIRVTAPNAEPWTKTITSRAGATEEVTIPTLVVVEGATPAPTTGSPHDSAPPAESSSSSSPGKTQRVVGLVVGGVGIAGLAAGGIFGLLAKSKNDDALDPKNCPTATTCTPAGLALTDEAKSRALLSTIFVIAGGTALATGAIVFFTAPKSSAGASTATLTLTPTWAPGAAGGAAAITW